jgi:23S rRNA (pseudouridine1915-N3)-methyltransferase
LRILLLAIGRLRPGPLKDLEQLYAGRIAGPLSIREFAEHRKLPPPELKEREATLLIEALPKGATVVALDERGKALASAAFAQKIGQWRDSGVQDLAFLIGGADGLAAAVKARADFTLSLGPATWPHFLARGMLLEQIYRAQQLLAGHPYHRE